LLSETNGLFVKLGRITRRIGTEPSVAAVPTPIRSVRRRQTDPAVPRSSANAPGLAFILFGGCHARRYVPSYGMVDTSYRVIPRTKHRFDVEMAEPSGSRTTIEGFASEHEANAWIVAQHMMSAVSPWFPPSPRRPTGTQAPPATPLFLQDGLRRQNERNHAAARRANVRAARERSTVHS
jgi:hypothetical protein